MAVETPQGILVGRAIFLLGKVYLSLIETKPRRSKRIDEATAGDAIQRRDVPHDAGGYEVFVRLANGNVNKALAKGLKQRLVSGVVAIVTRRTAGNQKGSQGEGGGRHEYWATRNHSGIMPLLARVCGAGPELLCQIGTVHFKGLADHLLKLAGWTRQVARGKSKEIIKGQVVAAAGSDACLEVRLG